MNANNENTNTIRGYKVFNPDWTCRDFKFEVGKIFEEDVEPTCCDQGFHFCTKAADCFNYYSFDSKNKVAEVEALGAVDTNSEDSKCCTNKIHIIRELTWHEVLDLVNTGKDCTGFRNSGDRNSGNWNSGNWNSGDRNSGDDNSGNRNTGNWNSGNSNSGDGNSGNENSGDCNSGNCNSGNWNSGGCNSGNWNNGDRNSGNCNTGNWNSGNWNSGNCNSGYRNSGDNNSGDWNSGEWNKTSFSSGCFNTEKQKIVMFNKPSDWTIVDWRMSDARDLLNDIPENVEWIYSNKMTDEEKKSHPEHKTTGGYLKVINENNSRQSWWDALTDDNKNIIKSLPNFDADIFFICTGIRVD